MSVKYIYDEKNKNLIDSNGRVFLDSNLEPAFLGNFDQAKEYLKSIKINEGIGIKLDIDKYIK